MAVDTGGGYKAELETLVATRALDRPVSEMQPEAGLRVVEENRVEQGVPALGRVALLARDIERAVGRVLRVGAAGHGQGESHNHRYRQQCHRQVCCAYPRREMAVYSSHDEWGKSKDVSPGHSAAVTFFTGRGQRLVAHHGLAVNYLGFVALTASYPGMGSGELEDRVLLVIENK